MGKQHSRASRGQHHCTVQRHIDAGFVSIDRVNRRWTLQLFLLVFFYILCRACSRSVVLTSRSSVQSSSVRAPVTGARTELACADALLLYAHKDLACATHARLSGLCLYRYTPAVSLI